MELSLFLARLLGVYFLSVAAIWIFRKKQFENILRKIFSTEAILALSGDVSLAAGLALVIGHPIAELSWRGLITLLGCFMILRGVMRLAFPTQVQNFTAKVLHHSYWMIVILVFLGIYLTYYGFG